MFEEYCVILKIFFSEFAGIGNQHYFYVDNVFALFGTVAASLFFLGVLVRS